MAPEHGQRQLPLLEPGEQVQALAGGNRNLYFRIIGHVLFQQVRQGVAGVVHGPPQLQMAGDAALGVLGQALYALQGGLELFHLPGDGVGGRCRDQSLHRAQKQRPPQFFFQLVQPFRDGALGRVQGLGGFGHILRFHQGLENLDIPFIHGTHIQSIPIRNCL